MDSIFNFFYGQDLQDYWDFFACGEIPLGRRLFYLNNPVNPV